MRKAVFAVSLASLAVLLLAATVSAAGPHGVGAGAYGGDRDQVQDRLQDRDQLHDQDQLSAYLGLTTEQVQALRQQGLSLADIATRQGVEPARLVAALQAHWQDRIEARLANGALTQAQATQLLSQLQTRAEAMVAQGERGGMRGAAVGAGPRWAR